jgi:membrane-associated protease RseP (regulator of RpoE activity)
MKILKFIFYIFSCIVLSGCANNYQKFYVQRIPSGDLNNLNLLKKDQIPNIYTSNNLNRDINALRSKRYSVIGTSEFNAQFEKTDNAIDVAKSIGATIVLISNTYTDTQSAVVPFFMPNTTTTTTTGMISSPYSSPSTFSGTSTAYGTSVVPFVVNNRRYDQVAVYFAQSNVKPKVGIFFNDLTDKERKEYGQNTGVVIQTVIENSPAFLANIVNGDLILKFDNRDVVNSNNLIKLIGDKKLGEKISFTLLRNGKMIEISLTTSDSYN